MKRKTILMINWDNYPNSTSGGVYAWAKATINGLSNFNFIVVNCLSNPNVSGSYKVPSNVSVIEMPLYGCLRHEEFYHPLVANDDSLPSRIVRTNQLVIENDFLPLYRQFLTHLISDSCDYKRISNIVCKLHDFFINYDVKKCLEHPDTFANFVEEIRRDTLYNQIPLKEAIQLFQLVQRILQILSIQIPAVDIIHSSNAWFPAMIGIYAKRKSNCPLIVTEHGVAFKDLLLYHRLSIHNEASNIFWKVFSSNIIRTIYEDADAVVPVCQANATMAESLHTDPSKIRVIHNGIDNNRFRPIIDPLPRKIDGGNDSPYSNTTPTIITKGTNRPPTVIFVGRIEILKDLTNLIQAISYVRDEISDVQCLIFGSSNDLNYARTCLALVEELELQNNVKFMGGTKEPEKAFNAGDVVVLSSIREGFPYTVVEAMACGKMVISTDVGGVREALDGYGSLVRSRHPMELAKALVRALTDRKLRNELGDASRKRIDQKFTLQSSVEQYVQLYEQLMLQHSQKNNSNNNQQQQQKELELNNNLKITEGNNNTPIKTDDCDFNDKNNNIGLKENNVLS